jgi:hypothetical protein
MYILTEKQIGKKKDGLKITLRFDPLTKKTPFFTHVYDEKEKIFTLGHYFDDLFEAIKDFKKRK